MQHVGGYVRDACVREEHGCGEGSVTSLRLRMHLEHHTKEPGSLASKLYVWYPGRVTALALCYKIFVSVGVFALTSYVKKKIALLSV